jgi:hypothetical protein
MQSMKEYAQNRGVSYEAVRKQVKRFGKELEGHITQVNRVQYLDDEAMEFLDQHRQKNPIVLLQSDQQEEIEALRAENTKLLVKIAELQDSLLRERETVKALQEEKIVLLEEWRQTEETKKKSWWGRLFGR